MEARKRMTVNVYYSDLDIFPNLGETIAQKWYRVERFCRNFVEVSFPEAKFNPKEWMNPYNQAEIFTKHGYFSIA